MENITKLGYIKSIQGEVSVTIQTEHLIKQGVEVDHIYNGDKDQTILDVIDSIRNPTDMIVIYSGSVIGRWNFKKFLKQMGPLENLIYSCVAKKAFKLTAGEDVAALMDDMEAVERRNGRKGGKPPSISKTDHKRIHKLRDDGHNAKEITAALGFDEGRHTTVWRYMRKEITNG